MTTISALVSVTLDGVMQGPGHSDEDTRGGFACGGWAAPYDDEVARRVAGEGMAREGAMLFGRRTYGQFMGAWAGRDDNPFSPVLDARRKYVASRTLRDPLPWRNSELLEGDAARSVAALKARAPEGDIVVLGSGELVRALLAAGLIDELRLSIHPLALGAGARLFPADGPRLPLALAESQTTTTGVIMATYRPAA